jgi:hypothetical protein
MLNKNFSFKFYEKFFQMKIRLESDIFHRFQEMRFQIDVIILIKNSFHKQKYILDTIADLRLKKFNFNVSPFLLGLI